MKVRLLSLLCKELLLVLVCPPFVMAQQSFEQELKQMPRLKPIEAKRALETFQVQEGFRLELVTHEPHVTDPVAAAYDENGLLYVAEMRGYPFTARKFDVAFADNPGEPYIGRIRLLRDEDGDGFYETSTIFADELSWPTGVACWKGGIFVIATPDLWYLKDTDGDGIADFRQKLYTGFRKYNIQAVANNLKWGVDHLIYGAGSGNGGTIVPGDEPNAKPLVLRRQDFVIDPVTGSFAATSGGARFGNCFNDWYDRFICNLRNPAQHVVLPSGYLSRNPHLVVPSAIHDVALAGDAVEVYRSSPAEPWRDIRARRWVAEGQKLPGSELVGAGFVTSASGITVYRGDAYPDSFDGDLFIGEVAGNLILRQKVRPAGVTYVSERIYDKSEFLTSTDNWFRPVNFVNAPDGCLHILDMYREVIEHPWSIPEDIKDHLDLISGRDRGRIYRLVPPDYTRPKTPRLGDAGTGELVALLESPNAWHRETAARLLFERQDPTAEQGLKQILTQGVSAQARVHALWSLAGLRMLKQPELLAALGDESPHVRRHAVLSAERSLTGEVLLKVLELARDPDIRVRFQVAFSLGESKEPLIVDGLAAIAGTDGADPWVRTAVLSSSSQVAGELFERLSTDEQLSSPHSHAVLLDLAQMIGTANIEQEVTGTLRRTLSNEVAAVQDGALQKALLLKLADGLKRGRSTLSQAAQESDSEVQTQVATLLRQSLTVAANRQSGVEHRVQAVGLLSHAEYEAVSPTLSQLMDPHEPQQLQLAAVATLASFRDEQVAEQLLAGWRSYTPAVRAEVVQSLLARPDRTLKLLAAIEAGDVGVSYIDPTRRNLLLKHANAEIRDRAEKVFGVEQPSPRKDVIAAYTPALELAGDADNGAKVFKRECATCHRLGSEGNAVGPNLATIKHRPPADLLNQILDPNREVAPDFLSYIVELDDGRVVTGVIAEETATSLTLQRAEDQKDTILRQNIVQIISTGKSLMPEELEKKMTQQEMADLLRFLLK